MGKKKQNLVVRQRVADHLQRHLDRHGDRLTKQALEQKLGVGAGTVSRILSLRSMGFDVFVKLCDVLGWDPYEVIYEDPKQLRRRSGMDVDDRPDSRPVGK